MRVRRSLGVWLLCFAAATPICGTPIPEAKNQKESIRFIPFDPVSRQRLSFAGCRVHVVTEQEDRTFDCTQWVKLHEGQYAIWLETFDRISNERVSVSYFGPHTPPSDGKEVLVPIYPSATIRLSAEASPPEGGTFRAAAARGGGFPFERRIPAKERSIEMKVPAGSIVFGLFDSEGNALALSGVVNAVAGRTENVLLKKPDKPQLLVVLEKAATKGETLGGAATLVVTTETSRVAPGAVVDASGRLFAIWYSLPPGQAKVELSYRGQTLTLATVHLSLRKIATVRTCITPSRTASK